MNRLLTKPEWMKQRDDHARQVSPWTKTHRDRRSLQVKHPVEDFLFDYYSFRPSLLERWSPGWGTILDEGVVGDFPGIEGWIESVNGICLGLEPFPKHRIESLQWMVQLLSQTAERPPQFACYGLHEWAMVYRIDAVRYPHVPLRMSPPDLAAFVESQAVCCTHYDAFRFYTESAKPLNRQQPSKATRLDMEQAGCIHVNMDLYKWAYKFWPWTPSDWILEAFELAMKTRRIDMQASPYDLSRWNVVPIKIETAEGKAEYVERQKEIYQQGLPFRKKLLGFYQNLLENLKDKN